MNKNSYLKNIKVNYIFSFFRNLNAIQGIWMLYLASKGLSLFEIGLLEGVFHVTSLLMETPTGAFADIFGRKFSRMIGVLLCIVSSILMIFSDSFFMFAVSFVFSALSYNFESGASEALVYDSLLANKEESRYMKIAGRTEVIFQATGIIALVIGGVIGQIEYAYVYYLAIALSVVALVTALFFKEPILTAKKDKVKLMPALKKQYTSSFTAIKSNSRLAYLIFFTSILSASVTLSFFYLQIAWRQEQLSILTIGIYLAVSSLVGAAGAFFADRLEKKFGENLILSAAPIIAAVSIFAFYFVEFALIPFAIVTFFEVIIFVATRDYINKIIPSEKRAAILSFESVIFSLMMILIFPLFGLISDYMGIKSTFLLLGALMLAMTLINLKIKRRNGV